VISDGNYGEIYPTGLYQIIESLLRYKKPIYITENGVPDVADRLRPSFLMDPPARNLAGNQLLLPGDGLLPLEPGGQLRVGSRLDAALWPDWLNPETQERTWRESGRLYQDICHSRSLTSQQAEKYAPELLQTIFCGQAPKNEAEPARR
jgi:hypothetical protein